MPYKSEKQKKLFRACKHNRDSMDARCPPKSVIEKFEREEKHKKRSKKR